MLVSSTDATNGIVWIDRDGALEFVIGNGLSAITTDTVVPPVEVPANFTIEAVRLVADASGSIALDLRKIAYASLPAASTDTIVASAPPTLSAALKSEDATLTGWTVACAKGDWIYPVVTSAATCKWVVCSLTGKVTAVS
jgi:hypothetical protein